MERKFSEFLEYQKVKLITTSSFWFRKYQEINWSIGDLSDYWL